MAVVIKKIDQSKVKYDFQVNDLIVSSSFCTVIMAVFFILGWQ